VPLLIQVILLQITVILASLQRYWHCTVYSLTVTGDQQGDFYYQFQRTQAGGTATRSAEYVSMPRYLHTLFFMFIGTRESFSPSLLAGVCTWVAFGSYVVARSCVHVCVRFRR